MKFLIRLAITAFVAYGLSTILGGVTIYRFWDAIIFALVLAFLNSLVKPVLIFLTLPATLITLGLFLFVINACIILLADKLLDGIKVDGFWWAMWFSFLLSLITSFAYAIFEKKDSDSRSSI